MMTRTARIALIAGAALGAGLLSGCGGHGKYTGEFKKQAELRVSQMKAATEWDMARQQFLSGDLEKALRSVDRSIALDDTVAKSHLLKGRILIELSRLEPALTSLERAIELKPEEPEAYYYSGIIFERISKPGEAFEAYTKAAQADPTDPQFTLAAAEMLIEQGKLQEAEALLVGGTASFEHNAGVRQTLGHLSMMRGDTARAIELFNEACLLGPGDAALREDLVRAQMAGAKFADAEAGLRWLLQQPTYKDRGDIVQLRVKCLVALDKPVEARTILLGVLNNPSNTSAASDIPAWIELGNISLILKDHARLREAAQRIVAGAPGRAEGHVFMALWLRNNGQPDRAVAALSQALMVDKTNSDAAVLQGIILQDLGRTKEAARSFRLALARNPGDAKASQLLAAVEGSGAAFAEVGTED